jgi:NAD(P)-dependent dehydrogenase (short-subunit alcohol dehydrogenase family)
MTSNSKIALVVGASRGLGLGLAKELADKGWTVTATVRNLDKASELKALGPKVTATTVDIDDATSVDALVKSLAGQKFDLVFVNAGVMGPQHQSALTATAEETGALFQTNAISPLRLARKLADQITDGTGVLAFMTSRMGSVADNTEGGAELYRASKAALNSMTRSYVASLKDRKLTVLSMHPGWVKTDMGGPDAMLDVATSVKGLVEQVEKYVGKGGHTFVDYSGAVLPW